MPRRPIPRDLQSMIVGLVRRDPRWLIVLLAIVAMVYLLDRLGRSPDLGPAPPPGERGYLACSWNVENLFDDDDDPKNHDPLDTWFAVEPAALRHKLDLLADALLRLNDGRGPDVLALTEVENLRAVELLQAALNSRLPTEWHYGSIVHDDNISGRRIEPAVLTRLPVDPSGTRAFGGRRILRARLVVEGCPLDVIVGHWTSRVTDAEGAKRLAYAQAMYDAFLEIKPATPGLADVLLCGDFNDEPDDESVRLGLRATGDARAVTASANAPKPRLLDLMAGRDPERFGTYRYRNRWLILDHLVVSPGLLDDDGWSVAVDTVSTIAPPSLRDGRGGPLRFGDSENPNPRGPSDHFSVCVWLIPPAGTVAGELAIAP